MIAARAGLNGNRQLYNLNSVTKYKGLLESTEVTTLETAFY